MIDPNGGVTRPRPTLRETLDAPPRRAPDEDSEDVPDVVRLRPDETFVLLETVTDETLVLVATAAEETLVLVATSADEGALPQMSVEQLDATLAHVAMPEGDGDTVVVVAGATLPPRAVTVDDIEAAFHRAELAVAASGLDIRETTVLLLKGGLAYLGLRSSPLDLHLPPEGSDASSAWTRWRTGDDGGYEISTGDVDVWQSLDGVRIDTRPMSPADAAGTWQRTESTRLGPTEITHWHGFTLDESGGFRRDTSRLTTIDADHFSPFGVTSSFRRDVTERGAYALLEDGMTIEFRDAAGYSYRELFFRAGDAVIVGDRRLVAVATTARPDDTATDAVHHGDTASWLAVLSQIEDERVHDEEQDVHAPRNGLSSR